MTTHTDTKTFDVAEQVTADGTRVGCLCVCGLEDGRIAWQRGLQARDH